MRRYFIFIVTALLLSIINTNVLAHDILVSNAFICYNWNNDSTELSVTFRGNTYGNYDGEYYDYIAIPDFVTYEGNSYPVTSILTYAFRDCPKLTGVTIPNSVRRIGAEAFRDCTNLKDLIIPNTVKEIGSNAFLRTPWLNNQPDGVVYAGKVAYKYKGSMPENTEIFLQEGTLSISTEAFASCINLTNITIPNSVEIIGNNAFRYCSGLTNVIIPNSVTTIQAQAFYQCKNLKSVTIPQSVTIIGDGTFENCYSLTDVYCYSENMPMIGSYVFRNSPIETATLHVPITSVNLYKNTEPWNSFGEIVAIVETPQQKCATPTISFANGKLVFDCETEGVEYITNISNANFNVQDGKLDLFSVYRFSVYAQKDGYLDSDVTSVNIDLNRLKGDMNNDGKISIVDAVYIVNDLIGGSGPILYYSVGTDVVTADNYTTANNSQQVNSLSAIPSTLLTVTTPGVYYILLPDQFEPEVGGVIYYNVTKLNVIIPGYSVYRTASLSAGVQIKRVNVGTSGSQIDYE